MFLFTKRKNILSLENTFPPHKFIDRLHERFSCEIPITYENYETKEIVRGSVHNYSKKGLYIEAKHCPTAGKGALIHMDNYSPNASGPERLKQHHVQVRWIRPILETEEQIRYGIGVQHCSDIYELFRLFGH